MKYCSKCKKVYADDVECECTKEKKYDWEKQITMIPLDCEPICKCGSNKELTYHPKYVYITSNNIDPSYCRCAECSRKIQLRIDREESMKYLIIDNCQNENKFCDDKDEVEEFLKYYTEGYEFESGPLNDVLILKLEPIKSVKESDFKPVYENYNAETGERNKEPNTHIVFWDEEMFKVEEVIVPEIEYDGDRSINW